jgi:hypothetical protein
MFFLPSGQQVRALRQATHDAVNVFLANRLKDYASKLVFEKPDPGTGLDPMFAPELSRNHKLSF